MARQRTDAEQQIADLLRTARKSLQMSVAFLSRMDGTTQTFEVVDSRVPVLFKDGTTARQDTSFCQKILDGDLPPVIDDVKRYPLAMSLPAARIPRIAGTPVSRSPNPNGRSTTARGCSPSGFGAETGSGLGAETLK